MIDLRSPGRLCWALLILLCEAGCTRQKVPPRIPEQITPVLTMQQVLRVNEQTLSIDGFLALRSASQSRSLDEALWTSKAVLSLQSEAANRGVSLSPPEALIAARYALETLSAEEAHPTLRTHFSRDGRIPAPRELRGEIDELISRSVVQLNQQLLTEFR